MTKPRRTSSLGTIGFMIGAVVFAAVAGMLLSGLMENRYSSDPVRPVVVAAVSIPAGQPFKKSDLKVALWPQSAIPAGYFAKIDLVLAASRVPLISFVRGEAVLESHLSQAKAGIGIAPLIDPNHRAMSIRTDDPVTLTRLVYPGARVDLICTMKNQIGNGVVAKTVIQNAKVLAVGESIDPLSGQSKKKSGEGGMLGSSEGSSGEKEARGVITLSLTPAEAERLSLASREGKIDVVLRGPKDDKQIDTSGATPVALVGDKGEKASVAEAAARDFEPVVAKPKPASRPRARRNKTAAAKGGGGGGGGVVIFKGGS